MRPNGADPHRVLGVARDATEDEIKRAYRALAKRHHPDAGKGSVDRFLEIQAAYEALIGGGPGRLTGGAANGRPTSPARRPAQPGSAASDGADGAARAGRGADPGTGWARGPRGAGARRPDGASRGGNGAAGRTGGWDPPGGGGSASGSAGRTGARSQRGDVPPEGRSAGRRRATLGSTSYDGAEEVFEPDWGGASWYGPTSGTYWTINPKEYADPRKHGPEYQARARRRARSGGGPAPGPGEAGGSAPGPDDVPGSAPGPGEAPGPGSGPGVGGGPGDAGGSPVDDLPPAWRAQAWTAAAAPGTTRAAFEHEPASDQEPSAASPERGTGPRAESRARTGASPAPHPHAPAPHPRAPHAPAPHPRAPHAASQPARIVSSGPGIVTRVGLALAGWLVPGLAVASLAGLPGGLIATLPLQAAGVAALALVPRVAWASIGGSLALALAAIPIVAAVAALGGPVVPGGPAPEAAVVLAGLVWAVGALLVGAGRVAPYPWRAPA